MPPREESSPWSMDEEVALRELFCKAVRSGNCALLLKLKEAFGVDPRLVAGASGETVMDLVLQCKQPDNNLLGTMMGWHVDCTKYGREECQ